MKWYQNMKIGKKLISGFVLIALINGLMGVYAIQDLKALNASDTELYKNITVPISEIGLISTEFQKIRVNIRDMITAQTPEDIQGYIDKISKRRNEIDKQAKIFESTILADGMRDEFNNFLKTEKAFDAELNKVIDLAKQNRDPEALTMITETGSAGIASMAEQDAIDKIMMEKVNAAKDKSDLNTAKANRIITVMLTVITAALLLSLFIGIFISNMITRPLKKSAHMINEMSQGHFGERLNISSKDEIGQMAKAMDFFADELQVKVIGAMNRISSGDVSLQLEIKDERDEITPALKKTVETIRNLNGDVNLLIHAATEGKLDIRGKSDEYSGAWKELIEGTNGLIDAFVAPINVTAEYIERISKGDIPQRITEVYLGDFNEIKNSINGCIDVMNELLSETNSLIQSTREGKLDARGNADKYNGDWKAMVKGINDIIDAFVAPFNVTAEYIERISRGDIPEKITDTYYGDFNEIKNNVNNCIEVMNGLLGEINGLIGSAREGKLDARGNEEAYSGEWGTLVAGINNLVDAFVKPINLTLKYIDRISNGDIPEKITETYHGDFNEIKNNLNNCIDIMNGLLRETGRLIKAAQEGQLDVRANTAGLAGDWENLLDGINHLVQAVVEPIQEVTSVMNQISQGILGVSIQGDYKGEFRVLSGAVNRTANDLKEIVGQISEIIGQISKGNLALEPIRTYQGDFVTISESLNMILDSLNQVLGDINMSSDQVSIGSKQVSDGSQALSQGATEQASSVQELTASISEVAAKTKANANSANEANDLTLRVKENAEQGNGHMKEMLKAMEEINDSSNNISKIIKVIDDIAFQTNILALNAAVEAARAGQHGKGFAVVAEEVRSLAARSAEAAKDTTELIQGSIKKSSAGTEIAGNNAKALIEIVKGVTKTAEIISEIAKSSNEQATGIAQIDMGLTQVSQVVQNNAATAEQSAASSEELSGQAELLKGMVGRFSLRKGTNRLAEKETKLLYGGSVQSEKAASGFPKIPLENDEFDKY
jgi:methyl-accepting chemotaxis protein